MKKFLNLLISAIVLLCVICCFCACNSQENKSPNTNEFKVIKASESLDGYATLIKPENRDLKILQLTDPQLDSTLLHKPEGANNEKTMILIEKLVKKLSPDLVVITGDLTMSRSENNWPWMKMYADLFEKLNTYWAPLYGNHDSQGNRLQKTDDINSDNWQISKELTTAELKKYKHCLISEGDAEKDGGVGNYFINIKNHKGDFLYTLSLLDTVYNGETALSNNDYYKREKTFEQLAWYEKHINKISDLAFGEERIKTQVIKSFVFFHVPVPELSLAYNMLTEGSENVILHYGAMLEGKDYYETVECGFFSKVKDLNSTTAMFFGHHHDNDISLTYQGIRLTMGQHSGFSHYYRVEETEGILSEFDYSRIVNFNDNRGGTLINLSGNALSEMSFTVEQALARELFDDYKEWSIDYENLESYQRWLKKQS